MEKINIIITMGGLGSRFREAGYEVPKYMIQARGKTLFEWSMDSLLDYNKQVEKYVFIVRKEDHAVSFIKNKCSKYHLGAIEIVELDYLTDGQATTALLGIQRCDLNKAVIIYNIDTFVEPYEMQFKDIRGDGHIPCFYASGEHWSFVKADSSGRALEVREKKRISDNCTLGAYYFSSGALYKQIYEEYYSDKDNVESDEKYVAPLYNYMIKQGLEVTISCISCEKVHVLGTPEELERFIHQ